MFGRNGRTAPKVTDWDNEVVRQIGSSLHGNEWLGGHSELLAECSVSLVFSPGGVTVKLHRPITVVPPIVPFVKIDKDYPPPPPPPTGLDSYFGA
jgi:hypothetical protein